MMTLDDIPTMMRRSGLIAIIDGGLPVDEMIEIGDALLAAPIQVMAVSLNSATCFEAISELRTRAGQHMLIGAADVRTQSDVTWSVDAGAQFLLAARWSAELAAQNHYRYAHYIPLIDSKEQAIAALRLGFRSLQIAIYRPEDCAKVAELCAQFSELDVIASGEIDETTLGECRIAGASVAVLRKALLPGRHWSMPTLIKQARHLRKGWEKGTK